MARLTVYHKPCLQCTFDDWHFVENWAQADGVSLKLRRTEYNPIWHRKATEIWGDEMYPPFITDGTNYITVEYAIEKLKRKEHDDMQDLFGAKKPSRTNRKVVARKKTSKKAKER